MAGRMPRAIVCFCPGYLNESHHLRDCRRRANGGDGRFAAVGEYPHSVERSFLNGRSGTCATDPRAVWRGLPAAQRIPCSWARPLDCLQGGAEDMLAGVTLVGASRLGRCLARPRHLVPPSGRDEDAHFGRSCFSTCRAAIYWCAADQWARQDRQRSWPESR